MTMIAVVVPKPDDTLLGTLLFQKCKDFKVYLPADDPLAPDYEARLSLAVGGLAEVAEPLVTVLEGGALPDPDWIRRVLRTARRHPDFDVYHVNLPFGERWPRRAKAGRVFRLAVEEEGPAPLSSFVFRTAVLRTRAVFRSDGTLDVLPTVLSCARERPVRNVWRQRLAWSAAAGGPAVAAGSAVAIGPAVAVGPAAEEQAIRARLNLLRWCEDFFGEEDHPLGVGDRLALTAATLARLFPSYTEEELKALLLEFPAAQGPVRKLRAAAALKSALRARQKSLA